MTNDERPPIFDERNRSWWLLVRRALLMVVREIERWYPAG